MTRLWREFFLVASVALNFVAWVHALAGTPAAAIWIGASLASILIYALLLCVWPPRPAEIQETAPLPTPDPEVRTTQATALAATATNAPRPPALPPFLAGSSPSSVGKSAASLRAPANPELKHIKHPAPPPARDAASAATEELPDEAPDPIVERRRHDPRRPPKRTWTRI